MYGVNKHAVCIKAEDKSIKARCLSVIIGQHCSHGQFKENATLLIHYFSRGNDELDAGIHQSIGFPLFFFFFFLN